jgi:hypothetical protein
MAMVYRGAGKICRKQASLKNVINKFFIKKGLVYI